MSFKSSKAFTLIELLIVVVIIGILAGVVLAILQPAKQQRRAREAVFQANVSKYCIALNACAASTTDATKCDDQSKLGVNPQNGAPVAGATGSGYYINTASGAYTDASAGTNTAATIYVNARIDTATPTCTGSCNYNFSTSAGSSPVFTGCIIN